MVDPKLIPVIFKSEKQKDAQLIFIHLKGLHGVYTTLRAPTYIICIDFASIDLHIHAHYFSLAKTCQLVGPIFLYQVNFSAPLKWRPGHVPPLGTPLTSKVIKKKTQSCEISMNLL